MTKAQEQMRLHRVDAAATRVIPKSAYWHLRHRPYRGGDANGAENREREEEGVPEILSGRSTQGRNTSSRRSSCCVWTRCFQA